jgi:DNA-binding NtrC family response regulator
LDTSPTPRILLVDDEDMVVVSISAFLRLTTDYEVETFTSPTRALQRLEAAPADVIVSDHLMPELTGLQLLAEARRLQPEAARILLTGHADKQSAIQAINQVGLYQYLEKPWDNDQLLLVINAALERTRLLRALASATSSLKDAERRLLRAFL